jgi:hypothetical protein
VAQRVNYIEQSPKIFKKFVEFLNATEESAIEEKVRDVVAHRACRFPPVGSCRRHLVSIGNSPRFSCCHPAGDHRGGAYPLGNQSLARRASRIRLRAAEQTFKLKLRGRVWISSPNLFTLSSMTYIFSNTFWRPMFAVANSSRPATASL